MSEQQPAPPQELVRLEVDSLPPDVARQIQEAQEKDPEFLRRVLLYGVTHKTVFETLENAWTR